MADPGPHAANRKAALMPRSFTFACRGFALLVPLAAVFAWVYWVDRAGSSSPERTNALIGECVDSERAAGRRGRACIGRVTNPCKARGENAHVDDQMECDEREFVLWSQLLQKELARLEGLLKPDQRQKLKASHAMWVDYQSADCRLPYAFFPRPKAIFAGPACTIELKAARALQLRAWRDMLEQAR